MLNEENSYQTIDFSQFGNMFAVAGNLSQIEIYDAKSYKQTLTMNLKNNKWHSNKVFSAKFVEGNPN